MARPRVARRNDARVEPRERRNTPRCLHWSRCSGGSCSRSRGTVCAMLQPVNDSYLSPKPRRDDVPVTRPNTFTALPEMKHCEVPDSFHSLSTLSYAACAPCATLHTIRFPRHSAPASLSVPQRAHSAFRATARPLRFPRHSAPARSAPLTAPQRARSLRSAHGAKLRHATFIALHRITLRSLRYYASHNALLRFSMLFCAMLRSIPLLILLYK